MKIFRNRILPKRSGSDRIRIRNPGRYIRLTDCSAPTLPPLAPQEVRHLALSFQSSIAYNQIYFVEKCSSFLLTIVVGPLLQQHMVRYLRAPLSWHISVMFLLRSNRIIVTILSYSRRLRIHDIYRCVRIRQLL